MQMEATTYNATHKNFNCISSFSYCVQLSKAFTKKLNDAFLSHMNSLRTNVTIVGYFECQWSRCSVSIIIQFIIKFNNCNMEINIQKHSNYNWILHKLKHKWARTLEKYQSQNFTKTNELFISAISKQVTTINSTKSIRIKLK